MEVKLFDFQQKAIQKFLDLRQGGHKRFYLGFKMGLGKTLTSLVYFRQLKLDNFLIITKANLLQQWKVNVEKIFGSEYNVVICDKAGSHEFELANKTIYLISYNRFIKYLDYLEQKYRKGKIINLPYEINFIFDESQALKSYKSQISKAIIKFQAAYGDILLLSGSVISNDLQGLYTQWRLLNNNEITYWNFARYFFIITRNRFSNWNVTGISPERANELIDQIDQFAYFKNTEFSNAINYIMLEQYNPLDKQALRNSAVIATKYNFIAPLDTPLIKANKIRQMLSGFIYGEHLDNEVIAKMSEYGTPIPTGDSWIEWSDYKTNGDKKVLFSICHSKFDMLVDKLKDSTPYLIFYNFDAERVIIETIATQAGYKCYYINGARNDLDKILANSKKDNYVIIAELTAAAQGLDGLQHKLSDIIYYSVPYSYEIYSQANARLHRTGQTKNVNVYHFIASKWEKFVLDNLEKYQTINNLIFEQNYQQFFSVVGTNDNNLVKKSKSS